MGSLGSAYAPGQRYSTYSACEPKPKDRAYSLASSKVQTVFFAESSDGVRVRWAGSNAAATQRDAKTTCRAMAQMTTAVIVDRTRRERSNGMKTHV